MFSHYTFLWQSLPCPHRPYLWPDSWEKWLKGMCRLGIDWLQFIGLHRPGKKRWGNQLSWADMRPSFTIFNIACHFCPTSVSTWSTQGNRGMSQGSSVAVKGKSLGGSMSPLPRRLSPALAVLPLTPLQRCRGRSTLLCGAEKPPRSRPARPVPNTNRDPGITSGFPSLL